MRSGATYRRGRRVYTPGERRSSSCDKFVSFLFTFLLITIPPLTIYFTEQQRYNVFSSLAETIDKDIHDLSSSSPSSSSPYLPPSSSNEGLTTNETVVHGKPTKISATTIDPEMGIQIHDSLYLSRNTEYCQWEEIKSESCQTCSRTKHKKNPETGNDESYTETYDCNCVTTFDYIKSWKSYKINSLFFDQPAAHHNPQRDPFPRKEFVSNDAVMEFHRNTTAGNHFNEHKRKQQQEKEQIPFHHENMNKIHDEMDVPKPLTLIARLAPSMIQNGIRGATTRGIKWVHGGIPPIPSFWTRWIPDRTRYEDSYHLFQYPLSQNAVESNFVYVGDGWFFSPYRASRQESMFKYFMQYIEGTIFDWQIGDLMPSCEAGDIRIRYTVQDPQVISILGQLVTSTRTTDKNVNQSRSSSGRVLPQYSIEPIQTTNGRNVGLVHEGYHSAQNMIITEDKNSMMWAAICRCLFLLWTIGFGRYVGSNVFDVDLARASVPTQMSSALCIWSFICGSLWLLFWGVQQVDGVILIVASAIFALFVRRYPPPTAIKQFHEQHTKSKFN